MTRRCIVQTDTGRCLGHPEADSTLWPPICPQHMELFQPLINAKARQLAQEMVNRGQADPYPGRPRGRGRRPTPMLKKGALLNEQDEATLQWLLRGAA